MSINEAVLKSIEGQKPSWKNALSRKFVELLGGNEPSTEAVAQDLILQSDQYIIEAYDKVRTQEGYLPTDAGAQVKAIMLARARKDNPALVPVINAEFSIEPEEMPSVRIKKGEPMSGEVAVTGHTSGSTLWLFDRANNRLQTMMRLLVEKEGKASLVDVYSRPLDNGFNGNTHRFDVDGTGPSRVAGVLELAEHGYEIKGWVPIDEIESQTVPLYDSTPAGSQSSRRDNV